MNTLDQKLLRDLLHMRGQVIAIILIVACGIASLVTMMSAYNSLQLSQMTYYDRYRFAQIFVQLERAPDSLAELGSKRFPASDGCRRGWWWMSTWMCLI